MRHIGEVCVLRDQVFLLSIIYDPKERDPSAARSYESCRKQIDDARNRGTIDDEAHHHLERQLTNARVSYIVFQQLIERPEFP